MEHIEMKPLSSEHPQQMEPPSILMKDSYWHFSETISLWSWTAAALLSIQAFILLIFPQLLLFMSQSSETGEWRASLTPFESFLAKHFGIFLLAIAILLVVNIPANRPYEAVHPDPDAVPSHPLLGGLAAAFTVSAFLSYGTRSVGYLGPVYFVFSGTIGMYGFWVIVFGPPRTAASRHKSMKLRSIFRSRHRRKGSEGKTD